MNNLAAVTLAVPSAERGNLKILDIGSMLFFGIAQQVDSSTAREWLNWIIPIALVVGAFKYTAWYATQARARAREQQPA